MKRNKKQKIMGAHYERNYVYKFYFHLVFVTKYHHLNEIMINKMEIMPKYVHMMISFKLQLAPANVVKALKGGSGRLFLKNHPNIKHDKFLGGHI